MYLTSRLEEIMGKYNFELDLFGNNTISWIANSVEEQSRVLEFGPANGRLTKYLSEQKKCKVDIVEIDSESGKEASQYAEKALIGELEGNIENYYWISQDIKYDYIIFADVLEHLIDPQSVLEHCSAVLGEKGKILVSIPNAAHNSVIIELFNDEFEYNPTGILDNTHLKFFTRKSFEKMAQRAGWTIIAERAKQIRVGENEIRNSYKDVSKNMFKELIHRENGNYYQYMFVLASCENYLSGEFERTVSLDSTSFYYVELMTEWNGEFDYKHSISRHFDPYYGWIDVAFTLNQKSKSILIKPINSNCILENLIVKVETDDGERKIEIEKCNGIMLDNKIFSLENVLELEMLMPENSKKVIIQAHVIDYDFNPKIYEDLLQYIESNEKKLLASLEEVKKQLEDTKIKFEERNFQINDVDNKLGQICREQEAISGLEKISSDNQLLEKLEKLETELQNKDIKIRDIDTRIKEICNDYETEIRRINEMYTNSIKVAGYNLLRSIKKKIFQNKKIDIYESQKQKSVLNNDIKNIIAVIPNYNYARFLPERLDSIVLQTYPVSKIIVLDDCSSDNSIEVIEKYIANNKSNIPIELFKNEKNSGSVFAQWQKAFNMAKSEYVWIAEADDSCNEKFLETVMKGFDDPEVVISYCESLTMDENNKILMGDLRVWIDIFKTHKWDSDYIKDGKEEVAETMCINNTIANVSSAVFRNGNYNDIIEGAKSYKLAGDWYVYMNILKLGKIAYFKESLNYHRMQSQGLTLSTSHEKEFEEIVRLQDFALENFDVSDSVKKKVYERREREKKRFGL